MHFRSDYDFDVISGPSTPPPPPPTPPRPAGGVAPATEPRPADGAEGGGAKG